MRVLVLLLGLLPGLVANMAQAASQEAEIFKSICIQNAPAFDSSTIERATAATRYSGGDIIQTGGVAYQPKRSCKVAFPIAGDPDQAEVQAIASQFAARTGGTVRARKSAIGGAVWFEVRIGSVKYGIEGGSDHGIRYFIIAKR
ncbi:hypothetical protein [Paenirhodobacter sp. CAU 1674]|uniref:hypothetical protein n=1 Tax=Paenirhodobacter sp. CAU 1674 TaxID=3032596 RepID=UPI0023DBA0F7|nr:hypothetical protein [Paenirhodobacter sp. CAU 1674]MDD8022320.1 hypothetical protein [Paracoccaceae bacterium]MDF2141480.1 hypothetical protein [Paenirhodobacter sp. CAU 1674]